MSLIDYSDGKDPIDNYVITKLGITPIAHDIECSQILTNYMENDYMIDIRIHYDGDNWRHFRWTDVELNIWSKGGINNYTFDVENEKMYQPYPTNEFEIERQILTNVMEKLKNIREVFDLVYTKKIFKNAIKKSKKKLYNELDSVYSEHTSGN